MKVIATDVSRRYNLRLKELHRVANPGEIFEVTEERFVYLNGNNPRGYRVVEWYQEPEEVKVEPVVEEVEPIVEEVEPVVVEPVMVEVPMEEKPKKKRTTKKKTEEDPGEEVVEEKPKKRTTKKKVEDKAE